LTGQEADRLMGWLRALRAAGTTCVYVSHRMDEVFSICDRITVLRDGRTADTKPTAETTPGEVIALMVGRAAGVRASPAGAHARPGPSKPALEVHDLRVGLPGAREGERLAIAGVSLTVHEGEVVGVAGAMGSGRTALLSTLFGCALGPVTGLVRIGGEPVRLGSPREAIARGVALLPEDRKGHGLVLD